MRHLIRAGSIALAGLATGVWPEAERFLESRSYSWFEPGSRREEGYAGWRRAVDAALHWARNPMR